MSDMESLVPRPTSRFLRVKCAGCESEQVVFSHATHEIKCRTCGEVIVKPTGGKALIKGTVQTVLG
jgi:small subunit ribosomal protein S27e